jgi:hypothetical protein
MNFAIRQNYENPIILHVMRVDPELIHPYKTDDLIHLGQQCDGGYVLNRCVLEHTRILVTLGINADWSFEEDFVRRAGEGVRVFGYDFSVSEEIFRKEWISRVLYLFSLKFLLRLIRKPSRRLIREVYGYARSARKTYKAFPRFFNGKDRVFFQKGVSNIHKDPFITFPEVMENLPHPISDRSVFLKIDIEQSEYRILGDVLRYSPSLTGMAIEFHDLDILWGPFQTFMEAARKDFVLTHVHGNNYGGFIPGTTVPIALEVTLVHKSLLPGDLVPFKGEYPLPGLDFPNDPGQADIPLRFN